jgi:hypothetical protein
MTAVDPPSTHAVDPSSDPLKSGTIDRRRPVGTRRPPSTANRPPSDRHRYAVDRDISHQAT